MLDSMYQEGTDQTLDDRVARPLAEFKRPTGFSVWNTIKAPATGILAGANESVGMASDILGAFGQVQAGYGLQADPSLLFDSKAQEQRRNDGEAARAEVASGEAFSTELGSNLRTTARDMVPNPETSNIVEQTLFGLTRFGVKAVGYTAAAGPVGAVFTGIDEGMTEADRLKSQGVDIGTRTQVGSVAGLSAAAATALPIAGNTVKQTVGLVAVGGPGGFIAQQAASRAILENAGYNKIAEQYDPFDPVGLAVSTLIPAGFGAYAMRGGSKAKPAQAADPAASRELAVMARNERVALPYNDPRLDAYAVTAAQREGVPPELMIALKNAGEKSGSNAVSPKGARGVAQLMPDNQIKYGVKDAADPIQSIDGMAKYLKDTIKQYNGDIQAVIADYNGGPRQAKKVQQGLQPEALETVKYLRRVNDYLAERQGTEAGRAAAHDPEAVAAARVNLVRETIDSWNLKDPADITGAQDHLNAILKASDQLGAGSRVDISNMMTLDNLSQVRLLDDMVSRLESRKADLLPDLGNMVEPGVIRGMRDELAQLQSQRPTITDEVLRARAKEIQTADGTSYKGALSEARKEFQTRIQDTDARISRLEDQININRQGESARQSVGAIDREISQARQARASVDAPQTAMKPVALAVKRAVAEPAPATKSAANGIKPADTATKPAQTAPDQAIGVAKPADKGNAAASILEAQTAEISKLAPDMMVQLEGMDAPMKLSDAMEAVKAEAAREVADAPLLKVAAECFLRNA